MGMNKIAIPDLIFANRLTHILLDDFDQYTDTQLWTKLAADSGSSVANSDNLNGLLTLTTGATNNNEACVKSTRKNFLFSNNKPLVFESRINYAEAATNAANIAAGFSSVFGANQLVDDGAGPATSFSGALIYKVDGETVWRAVSSLSTTQNISKSTATAGGTADQTLRIEVMFTTSTLCEVTYFVDGVPLIDSAQTARNLPIKHILTYTSAAAMGVGAYVKDGSGTGEVLNVDYIAAIQGR